MITTPSMGLKRWDQPNDIFSYVELSDNFALLDSHDHTTGKGVQIPTAGIANLAVDATKVANSAITDAKVASGSLTDTRLASPNNGVYKPFAQGQRDIAGGTVSATYPIATFRFNPADFTVANKTTVLRTSAALVCNATAPGAGFTFGLYQITGAAGGSGVLTYTFAGAPVTLSTVFFAAPSAGAVATNAGPDFTPPATGMYALCLTLNGPTAAASYVNVASQMLVRHV